MQKLSAILVLLLFAQLSLADEIRPGYLEVKETEAELFSVLWKRPAKGSQPLDLQLRLPENCVDNSPVKIRSVNNTHIQQWLTLCAGGLTDHKIEITGLNRTNLEVILQLQLLDGTSHSARLKPADSIFLVPVESSALQVIVTYTLFGVEHILIGIDHLLFVFALLLIVRGNRRLIITITAFTIAHSITLAAATLGLVHIPQQPVEAVIALSILFLAVEIIHGKQGKSGYAARWPWLVAFCFGLLHGFGFAGALTEIGLPQQSIPLALVFFNIGVELGQLFFILCVILLASLMRMTNMKNTLEKSEGVAVYAIGGLASFWLIERISAF